MCLCFSQRTSTSPNSLTGLNDLLEYQDDDIEDTFMQTFRISYKDVFGVVYTHDLKVFSLICSNLAIGRFEE